MTMIRVTNGLSSCHESLFESFSIFFTGVYITVKNKADLFKSSGMIVLWMC